MPAKTVLVTGATGYIAKHLVLQLLNAGHTVIGSARDASRTDELHAALSPHLDTPAALERLRVVPLDLNDDTGWTEAMAGADVLMHTASPFPLAQPRDEGQVIRPAVDGALRALKAARAAGVGRVILTSSSAAIMNTALPSGRELHDERDWSDLTGPGANAYLKSKTLAERAAWDWQRDQAPDMALTVINPSLVLGPPLDDRFGTSVSVIQRLLRGKDPMQPAIGFPCVDVRDIALMHVRAMERDATAGLRIAGAERFLWFADMARLLKQAYPDRRIATRVAPDLLIRLLGLFDPAVRTIIPDLGRRRMVDDARARDALGMTFRDTRDSVRETAAFLIGRGLV